MTQELLQKLLHYDPMSGVFVWLVQPRRAVYPGAQAGFVHKASGYFLIKIGGRKFLGSRLAWLYMTGDWPEESVDHWNLDKADTRWENLRAANHSQNMANRGRQKNNTTGIKGVYKRDGRRWEAMIRKNGVLRRLGTFETAELAAEAYAKAAEEAFGPFARTA